MFASLGQQSIGVGDLRLPDPLGSTPGTGGGPVPGADIAVALVPPLTVETTTATCMSNERVYESA